MVHLSNRVFQKYRKFFDSARIYVRGGNGGNGLPKWNGVGGKGGDVYIKACKNYTLQKLKTQCPTQRFIAERGEDSRKIRVFGMQGKDVYVKSPIGVTVLADANRVLGELNEVDDEVLVAKGGCGGCSQTNYLGQEGQRLSLTLDLKLVADVGFVGFPNAGKSTLLKAISRAQPKVANYPFTTLHPNIGVIHYEDFRTISAADLPGLIEGSHQNFGMGHKFLKHCMRTKILLFVIDLHGFRLSPDHKHRNALETVYFLNKELEMYNDELLLKPAILVINKIDQEENQEIVEQLQKDIVNLNENLHAVEEKWRPNQLVKFDAVIPVSAKKKENIDALKQKIRTIIDIYHDKKLSENGEEAKAVSDADDKSVMYL